MGGESITPSSRRGVRLARGRDFDIMQGVHVSEVFSTDFSTINRDATLTPLAHAFDLTHSHGILVLESDGALWGVVTVTDFDKAISDELPLPDTKVHKIVPLWIGCCSHTRMRPLMRPLTACRSAVSAAYPW